MKLSLSKILSILLAVCSLFIVCIFFVGCNNNNKENIEQLDTSTYTMDGDYIYFGTYPQTLKSDDVSIVEGSTSKGYYLGSDGEYYAKIVTSDSSIAYKSMYGGEYVNYKFSNGKTIGSSKKYYFKVEPIRWRIIKSNSEKALLICDVVLDAQAYNSSQNQENIDKTTIYPSNYEYSDLRKWLNQDFFDLAFTPTQQKLINTYAVDNSAKTTYNNSNTYCSNKTFDKIFVFSYQDFISESYGFNISAKVADGSRSRLTTDYSRAKGANMAVSDEYYGNGAYLLRSSDTYEGDISVSTIYTDGSIFGEYVDNPHSGVVPALLLQLNGETTNSEQECNHKWMNWIVSKEATCTDFGIKTRICSVCFQNEANTSTLGHHYINHVCSKCGNSESGQSNHSCVESIEKIVTPPTCKNTGVKAFFCSCGKTIREETLPIQECTPGNWIIDKESTCTDDGSKLKECIFCKKSLQTETIPASHLMNNGNCMRCDYKIFTPISSAEELLNLPLAGNYILTGNIDLGGREWTPIGKYASWSYEKDSPFIGTFDGNGYTISNFKLTNRAGGLFGYNKGTIKNLGVKNFTIKNSNSGGLVYYNEGIIQNCYSSGNINLSATSTYCVGGLVAINQGTISNSYATGNITTSVSYDSHDGLDGSCTSGGLVAVNRGTITHSYATGNITTSLSLFSFSSVEIHTGGLVAFNKGSILNSYATGNTTISCPRYNSKNYIGGLIGSNDEGTITNCYATGKVTSDAGYSGSCSITGGLVGKNNGKITNSYATGDVTSSAYGGSNAGGLVGINYNEGTITSCYATGDVCAYSGTRYHDDDPMALAGGLVSDYGGTITNCYRGPQGIVTAFIDAEKEYYSPTNTVGTSSGELQSITFHLNTLNWSADDWNFAEGKYPTLKNVGILS